MFTITEIRNFDTTLPEGISHEAEIHSYLKNMGYLIIDHADDPVYQDKDIDLEFGRPDGQMFSMEIKSDTRMHETGNIVIELGMHRETGFCEGWFHKCQADVLCFYDVVGLVVYLIDWQRLKYAIENGEGKHIFFKNKIDNCVGELILVSVKDLEEKGFLFCKPRYLKKVVAENAVA